MQEERGAIRVDSWVGNAIRLGQRIFAENCVLADFVENSFQHLIQKVSERRRGNLFWNFHLFSLSQGFFFFKKDFQGEFSKWVMSSSCTHATDSINIKKSPSLLRTGTEKVGTVSADFLPKALSLFFFKITWRARRFKKKKKKILSKYFFFINGLIFVFVFFFFFLTAGTGEGVS